MDVLQHKVSCTRHLSALVSEFTEFFFQKGNALNLAIAVVVGTQV